MEETAYRASRIARVLGSPTVYGILQALHERRSLHALAAEVSRTVPCVCHHLGTLKKLDLVRYESSRGHTKYWLKYPELLGIMKSLESLVGKIRIERTRQEWRVDTRRLRKRGGEKLGAGGGTRGEENWQQP